MKATEKAARMLRFEELCRRRGIPLTVQRRAVLEELLGSRAHPTADRVLSGARKRVPGVSATTVYRVLELLVDMGLARKTCSPGNACRYDPHTHRHHHLVCLSCDRIIDLDEPSLNDLPLPARRRTGFELVDYSVQFRGTCARCLGRRGKRRRDGS